MGLFDSLLRMGVKKIVNDALDKAFDSTGETSGNRSAHTPVSTQRYSAPEKSVEERIESVCSSNYPEYTLEKNVPSSRYGGSPQAYDFTCLLCKDGSPHLAMLILTDHSDYRRKSVRLAHEDCEQIIRIHCLNFMEYLPTTEEYITERLASISDKF